jgi:hypothetical protein
VKQVLAVCRSAGAGGAAHGAGAAMAYAVPYAWLLGKLVAGLTPWCAAECALAALPVP